ncbi:MAG: peptide-methionine (S)-S-oxide reductase MsrA [Promethearchaeota archaeon]
MKSKKATLAAGCFWGVEASFRKLKGVLDTRVGYTGGHYDNPTYEDVCSHKTGHAESVEIIFDPEQISYEELLDHFFKNHDPTTPNRQGPDIGSQYRSAIFYHDEEQKQVALKAKEKFDKSGMFSRPIVTEIVQASTFWEAEEYHQQYLEKRKKGIFSFKIH